MKRLWKWTWRSALVLGLLGFVALNLLARQHAHSMTHFAAPDSDRTVSAEKLGFGQKLGVLTRGVVLPKPVNRRSPEDLGLPFETVSFTGHKGISLESWLIPGSGETCVLLFHGYAASKEALLGYAAEFHQRGSTCLLVDFHGSGGSGGQTTSMGFNEAEDVVAAWNWAKASVPAAQQERIVLYGLSMGGAAIMRACAELDLNPDAVVIESVFPSFRETVAKRFHAMHLPAFPAADLLVFWGGRELGIDARSHNPRDYALKIQQPVLILTGEHDVRVPLSSVRIMAERFPRPAELRVYDAVHRPFLDTHPDAWRKDIGEFLKTLP